jgi:hypothetical protein
MVHAGFSFDLAKLIGFWARKYPEQELRLASMQGTLLVRQRYQLAKNALKEGAGWLLWLDSDMRFPYTALEQKAQQIEKLTAQFKEAEKAGVK